MKPNMMTDEMFEDNLATFCDRLCKGEQVSIPFAWLPNIAARMTLRVIGYDVTVLSYDNNNFCVIASHRKG